MLLGMVFGFWVCSLVVLLTEGMYLVLSQR